MNQSQMHSDDRTWSHYLAQPGPDHRKLHCEVRKMMRRLKAMQTIAVTIRGRCVLLLENFASLYFK
jgi:hypothetical protein